MVGWCKTAFRPAFSNEAGDAVMDMVKMDAMVEQRGWCWNTEGWVLDMSSLSDSEGYAAGCRHVLVLAQGFLRLLGGDPEERSGVVRNAKGNHVPGIWKRSSNHFNLLQATSAQQQICKDDVFLAGHAPPQTKEVTIVGKNAICNRENFVGPVLVHKILGPRPPPPTLPPFYYFPLPSPHTQTLGQSRALLSDEQECLAVQLKPKQAR